MERLSGPVVGPQGQTSIGEDENDDGGDEKKGCDLYRGAEVLRRSAV